MNKKVLNFIRLFLGIFIIILLFWKIGAENIINVLFKANLKYVFLAFVMSWLTLLLAATNVHMLVSTIKKISFFKIFKYYLLSWSTGLVSPGKFGEFSLVYYLRAENIPMGKSSVTSLLEKLGSVVVVFSFASFGFVLFFDFNTALKISLIMMACIILACSIFFSPKGREMIKKYVLRKYSSHFKGFSQTLNLFFTKKKMTIFYLLMMSILKWTTGVFFYVLIFKAFGVEIDYFAVLLISSMTVIVSILPITTSGLGIRESISIFFYNSVGIQSDIVFSMHLIALVINYGSALLSFALIKD